MFLERTSDFPLAQHIGKELDVERRGGGLPSFEEEGENCVAYFRLIKCENFPIANYSKVLLLTNSLLSLGNMSSTDLVLRRLD